MGGFKEYWDLIRKYPKFQGGFIWDFVDQSVRWKNKDGIEIYAYGGDFNKYDGSDNNFCDNGLIALTGYRIRTCTKWVTFISPFGHIPSTCKMEK